MQSIDFKGFISQFFKKKNLSGLGEHITLNLQLCFKYLTFTNSFTHQGVALPHYLP